MRYFFQISTLILVMFLSGACRHKEPGKGTVGKKGDTGQIATGKIPEDLPGKALYEKYCLSCHQADGSGVPGMFPPLIQTEIVMGGDQDLIKTVLFGREGPIVVKGEEYNQIMPAQDYLSDQQIADILTYIRKMWGNSGSAIDPAEVKKIRKK